MPCAAIAIHRRNARGSKGTYGVAEGRRVPEKSRNSTGWHGRQVRLTRIACIALILACGSASLAAAETISRDQVRAN